MKSLIRKISKIYRKIYKNRLNLSLIFLLVTTSFLLGILTERNFIKKTNQGDGKTIDLAKLEEKVIPQKGYRFKINWRDLGKKMVEDGVIDKTKLAKAITGSDTLPENLKKYLEDGQSEIELNQENAQFWVDVFWGFGLANKNKILESGPMVEGGRTANFASTGGYTLGVKAPMELYNKFSYITLSEEQQKRVEEIAGGVFRPCCGNSTAFPDCNHGMAALGLIELMVSQGFSKEEIYKTVLKFNSYWFPQTYLDIAYHFEKNSQDYKKVSPQEILSKTFSSAMGYQAVKRQIGSVSWPALRGAGSCGA